MKAGVPQRIRQLGCSRIHIEHAAVQSDPQLQGHIEEINEIQRGKRDAMLAALDDHFANTGATWSKPKGGLFIWLKLPASADAVAMQAKVLESADVGYLPGPGFSPDGVSGRNYLRLCFGYNTPAEISEGIGRLAQAFRAEGMIA